MSENQLVPLPRSLFVEKDLRDRFAKTSDGLRNSRKSSARHSVLGFNGKRHKHTQQQSQGFGLEQLLLFRHSDLLLHRESKGSTVSEMTRRAFVRATGVGVAVTLFMVSKTWG